MGGLGGNMPALNFKKQFAPLIESGEKRCTIRTLRKDGRKPKVGDILYLYIGMRTKNCRKLKEAVCISSNPIIIDIDHLEIDGIELHSFSKMKIAFKDGFDTYDDFIAFFQKHHGLPFHGYLIKW